MVNIKGVTLSGLTLGVTVLILQLFLFISADWVFGAAAVTAKEILLIYFILQVAVYSTMGIPEIFYKPLSELKTVFLYFILTVIVASFLKHTIIMGMMASFEPLRAVAGFGFIYIFVKVFTEETIFRDILPKQVGHRVAQLLFALFHIAILSVKFAPSIAQMLIGLVFLYVLGSIWYRIYISGGAPASIGSHAGWNSIAGGLI